MFSVFFVRRFTFRPNRYLSTTDSTGVSPYFLGVIEIVGLATFLLPLRPSTLTTDHVNKLKYLTAVGILVAGRGRDKYEN